MGLCTNGFMNDIQWRILSGKSCYLEHLPLFSRAAANFRKCFDPIVAISGHDLFPVMVYGRNVSGQEFGGMYCIVFILNSIVVSVRLLKIFGCNIDELPLVATSREYQEKGYFQVLLSCIERLLSSLNVEKLVLSAAGDAESICTKKLGFYKMSEDQLSKYLKEGLYYFKTMKEHYGFEPSMDHYGAMVDLLGRAGKIVMPMIV
ncbi:unnamed protein product [Vicia faba]|uniref:Increased DNA methylation 1 C-terminal domain-containing protein n=1 Tax=Vicia faba TaxID=3906 RepID=A0AAV1AV30_VICFA|nr:unnamed protein product [Vicia faba]